jgi:hypothetical protein
MLLIRLAFSYVVVDGFRQFSASIVPQLCLTCAGDRRCRRPEYETPGAAPTAPGPLSARPRHGQEPWLSGILRNGSRLGIYPRLQSLLCRNRPRMNGLNARIASKVPVIAGQYLPHVVNPDGGGQTRVVDLNTGHAVCDKNSSPLFMHPNLSGNNRSFSSNNFARRSVSCGERP